MSITSRTFCYQLNVKQPFHTETDNWSIFFINVTKFPNYPITFKFLPILYKIVFYMLTPNFLFTFYNKFNITRYVSSLFQITFYCLYSGNELSFIICRTTSKAIVKVQHFTFNSSLFHDVCNNISTVNKALLFC